MNHNLFKKFVLATAFLANLVSTFATNPSEDEANAKSFAKLPIEVQQIVSFEKGGVYCDAHHLTPKEMEVGLKTLNALRHLRSERMQSLFADDFNHAYYSFDNTFIDLGLPEFNVFFNRLAAPDERLADIRGTTKNLKIHTICFHGDLTRIPRSIQFFASLKSLNLSDNKISDLSPLRYLENLDLLLLSKNHISDLTPLAGKSFIVLDLGSNRISDLAPLESVRVSESLKLEDNQITEYEPISQMHVKKIYIANNPVPDLSEKYSRGATLLWFLSRFSPDVTIFYSYHEGAVTHHSSFRGTGRPFGK